MSLDFFTGLQEFLSQLFMNTLFIGPAAFLCFYSIGQENLKWNYKRITIFTLISIVIYSCLFFPLWYLFSFPDTIFFLPYVVVGFIFYMHTTKAETSKLIFIFLVALYLASFSNILFNVSRRVILPVEPNDLWRWQELLLLTIIVVVVTPPAAWFMRNKVWPAVWDLKGSNWKYLWILPTILILIMQVPSYLVITEEVDIGWQITIVVTLLSAIVFVSLIQILSIMKTQQENHREKEILRMVTEQSNRYEEIAAHNKEVKILRHDMRHHLSTLDGMLRDKQYAQAEKYLNNYSSQYELTEAPLCDCYVVDIIARRYKVQAEKLGINIDFNLSLPSNIGVDEADICVVLGNLLENALKACEAQTIGKKHISVSIKIEELELLILVENSSDTKDNIPKGDGLGIPSVYAISKKYSGAANFEHKNNIFSASVLLNRTNS